MRYLRYLLKTGWVILFLFVHPVHLFAQHPVSYAKNIIIESIIGGYSGGSLEWIDGKQSLLVFNYGCGTPFEKFSFTREYSLFSFTPSLEEGAWSYERQFTDSLSPLYLYIVDLDGDGLDDIATQNNWSEASDTSRLSFYFYKGSSWERFNYNAGKALGIGMAADILPYPGEELVFTYANDPDLSRDADEWDPKVGIAVMARDSGEPIFFFDDTRRHGIAGIGGAKEETGHFYFVEGFLDSETWPGNRRIAHIVKYAFFPETKQFTELYRTKSWEPHLSRFQGGDREILVKDSEVSVLKGNSLFRNIDNGSDLKQLAVQQVDTLLMDSFWFDYDMDGTDEIFGSQYSPEPITSAARFSLVCYEEIK